MGRKLNGSIKQLPSGRWKASVRGRHVGTFDSKDDAREAVDVTIEALAVHNKQPVSLRDYGAAWLDKRELAGVAGIKQERSMWRHYIRDTEIASMPLASVRQRHVAEWIHDLTQRHVTRIERRKLAPGGEWESTRIETTQRISRKTVNNIVILLRCAFRGAGIDGFIRNDPTLGVQVPRMRKLATGFERSRELTEYLTEAEIARVVSVLGDDPLWHSLYTVAIYGGLRKSELLALRWDDLILTPKHPRIRVRRAGKWADGKSYSSSRDVPLAPPAAAVLRAWRAAHTVAPATGVVWPRADGRTQRRADDILCWPDRNYTRDGVKRSQAGIRSRAGITRPVRFHDLRHTCATHLLRGTWTDRPLTLDEVKQWMGHSSRAVTERYAHIMPDGLLARVDVEKGPLGKFSLK